MGLIIFILVIIIILAIICSCATNVNQNQRAIQSTFGAADMTNDKNGNKVPVVLQPGIHLHWPIISKINKVDVSQSNVYLNNNDGQIEVTAQDKAKGVMNVSLTYHVNNVYAYLWRNGNSETGMRTVIQSEIRNVVNGEPLNKALGDKKGIQEKVFNNVNAATAIYGVKVDQINITNFQALPAIQNAYNEQTIAKQDAIKKSLEASGDAQKIATENSAENSAMVSTASAQAESTSSSANAREYAIEQIASAEKQRIDVPKSALAELDKNPSLRNDYFKYLSTKEFGSMASGPSNMFVTDTNGVTSFGQNRNASTAVSAKVWDASRAHSASDSQSKSSSNQ